MAKLILNPSSSNRREVALPRAILSIGRDPSNDLVLPDAMVSRRHAVIEYRGNQYFLRDCSSSNGSVVNGDRISEKGLRDGDLVAIGTARLLFRDDLVDPGAKVVPHPSATRLECPACHAECRRGDQFCRECGSPLAPPGPPKAVCPSCGTAVSLPARFCNACGAPLAPERQGADASAEGPSAPADVDPSTELDLDEPPTKRPGAPIEPVPAASDGFQAKATGLTPLPRRVSPAAAALSDPPRRPWPASRPSVRAEKDAPLPDAPARPGAASGRPAGLGRRLPAALVDAVFVSSGMALLLGPVAYYWWSRDVTDVSFLPVLVSVAAAVLAAVLGGLYYVYCWGVRGATPGQELLDLRIEDEAGRWPIGPGRAALRLVGYLLSSASLGVGFLMIAFSGSGLHDRVARTRVVRRGRKG
jgi:uncharacterized RDD family membrane protein YckC